MSKSGLFAHFGSKEELQLATIDTAAAIFAEQVIAPALPAATGLERLKQPRRALPRSTSSDSVFPGGCFFASVAGRGGHAPRPGARQRDADDRRVVGELEAAVRDAQAEGEIDSAEDPGQLAFEIDSYLLMANAVFVITQSPVPMERARHALARRLAEAAPKV